jgi:carbon starvation protein CstA
MPSTQTKASTFLLFPWGLLSIVLILVLNLTLSDAWFNKNWSWIALVLIIPAAILENFKVGYSTMRIMFLKVVFSLLSFLLVGIAFGSALTHYYNKEFVTNEASIKAVTLPWYVLLALVVLLLIQVAQLFSMLKAVKREFMQMDPDQ